MKKYNRTFLFVACIAMASLILVGSKCKKKDEPPPPDDLITCTSNITDGCLDDWKVYSWYTTYINPTGEFLQTLNELSALPPEAGGPGPVTADTVTDCVQGKYAARLISGSFSPLGSPIFIPGYIGSSILDIPNATIHLGKPYTQRPLRFQAYYKYAPANGDSALIEVMLSRFNTGAGKRDTISFDKIIIKNGVSSYTQIDMTLSYRDSINSPDTILIAFSASADTRFNDLYHCSGQVGSTMWVDDLKFVFP